MLECLGAEPLRRASLRVGERPTQTAGSTQVEREQNSKRGGGVGEADTAGDKSADSSEGKQRHKGAGGKDQSEGVVITRKHSQACPSLLAGTGVLTQGQLDGAAGAQWPARPSSLPATSGSDLASPSRWGEGNGRAPSAVNPHSSTTSV